MRHTVPAVVAVMLLTAGSVSAHHGYANYATEHRITIEGDLQDLRLANPHVIMRIRTADSTLYTCLWQGATWVEREANVTPSTFKIGDHLVIYGAPARDAARKELQSLREVRRPSDGWAWVANY